MRLIQIQYILRCACSQVVRTHATYAADLDPLLHVTPPPSVQKVIMPPKKWLESDIWINHNPTVESYHI